ncbi:ABC transporter permease [Nesterenkonia ebinurensis]|uniref:ABC transporter permease n=1 Tax=Nesterenkonia ebinurensis TaxID=2608252 RepID=UPI00123D117E|nr:ABC transporter permease [Nesterenkonia ebinurensis]
MTSPLLAKSSWKQAARPPIQPGAALTIGLVLIGLVAAAAIFAPFLTPFDPLRGDSSALQAPQSEHPMGTDNLGRDVFSQVVYGLRSSLLVGVAASAISLIVGSIVGSVAGYVGGTTDTALMRFTEIVQVVPRIFLVILTVALFGQNLWVTTAAIGLTSWPPLARLLRAEFLARKESEYVAAARVMGCSPVWIIFREILPNAVSPLIVTTALNVATAVLLEASLSFLGLSDPNVASLGRILQSSIGFISVAWWMSVFPGIMIALIALAMNLIGEGVEKSFMKRRVS